MSASTGSHLSSSQRSISWRTVDLLTVAMLLRAHHMALTGELAPDLARAMLGAPA